MQYGSESYLYLFEFESSRVVLCFLRYGFNELVDNATRTAIQVVHTATSSTFNRDAVSF